MATIDTSTDYENELQAEVVDTRRPLRNGLRLLALIFGGFMLWAAFVPLDEGVPTPGVVSIATKRKPIQHLSGGILEDIYVREGQMVDAGQVLARLNDGVARTNFEAARQHYMGLQAMESRLVAARAFASQINFPSDVLSSADPMVQEQVANQRSLFASQRAGLDAELSSMKEAILGQRAMIAAYKSNLESRREQYASLLEDMDGIRGLAEEGYVPRSRERELQRQLSATRGAIAELNGSLSRTYQTIAELESKMVQRRQAYREQAETMLASIRLELQADREKFKATGAELARTLIRSPVAGQVVGLQLQSKGAVLQPAQKLMDIVPNDEELLIEARLQPTLIDRVKEGQLVEVQFSTFANSPSVVVDGRVKTVARDLLAEPTPNGVVAFYTTQIVITKGGMAALGKREMRPGMPVEVIIKTGERTLLQYLLQPLTKRFAGAMKEE